MKTMQIMAGAMVFGAVFNASATITFGTGNQQYSNVNLPNETGALSVTGTAQGLDVIFSNMIGPDGTTQITMHSQNGVASIENNADTGQTTQGFSSLTMQAQAGYGFTAGDFKLDELNDLASGMVTFVGTDQFGNTTTASFSIRPTGQNSYQFSTADGELVTQVVFSVPTTALLADIKSVSVDMARVNAIPEPTTIVAGVLLLAPLGTSVLRILRRNHTV